MKNKTKNRAGQEGGSPPLKAQSARKPPFLTCTFFLRIAVAAGVLICACLAGSRVLVGGPTNVQSTATPEHQPTETEEDAHLQAAATTALGQREGAILIVDPQTGRVRAVVNPEVAFGKAFPPGSTIKPFIALAALRAEVIAPDTRLRCRQKYKREDVVDSCSHPPSPAPFTPAEALAHSCNYYFASVGERLDEEQTSSLLADFGLGQMLARGRWQPESAVGEGAFLQVTPIQLARAYAALFNGQLEVNGEERNTLIEGMRGAVTFGTAEKADLDSLPAFIIGKTGTSTPLQGFRPQGWFVGIAFASDTKAQPRLCTKSLTRFEESLCGPLRISAISALRGRFKHRGTQRTAEKKLKSPPPPRLFVQSPEPSDAQLVVVVYLKNAHGSDAAQVARSIFEQFSGKGPSKSSSTYVTVNQVSENITQKIALEDYVLQVVSTEASVEDQIEALKAQAITARTYALKNIGRHREQGYDFCSTTHCQRFESNDARTAVAVAVKETSGLVLRDDRDLMVDSFYSASCGGMTANLKSIWNTDAPGYLRGVQDSYCNTGSHYRWTDVVASDRLLTALRSDPRTDVGGTIRDITVTKIDRTGRAELVALVGDRRRAISGWEFKLIVGRALGWQFLKSSRFTVSRSGSKFVFRGGGFGHGLGLCQEGSHVMAERGQSFHQILAHYFPGTKVSGVGETRRLGDGEIGGLGDGETRPWGDAEALGRGDTAWRSAAALRRVSSSPRLRLSPSPPLPVSRSHLSASHFRLTFPQTIDPRDAQHVLSFLESNRAELLRRVSTAGIHVDFPNMEVVVNETTGDFVGRTGMPAWAGAATKNNHMELQPLPLLKQRRILETTLRHELVHVLVDSISRGQTPRWLAEGMAVHFAGEGKMIERYQQNNSTSVETVEKALASARSAAEMRSAYAGAYKLVKELIQAEGENKVWKRVALRQH